MQRKAGLRLKVRRDVPLVPELGVKLKEHSGLALQTTKCASVWHASDPGLHRRTLTAEERQRDLKLLEAAPPDGQTRQIVPKAIDADDEDPESSSDDSDDDDDVSVM